MYAPKQLTDFAKRYLDGEDRDQLDPILHRCVAAYIREVDEDGQVAFKSKARGFVRTYAFLPSILSHNNPG